MISAPPFPMSICDSSIPSRCRQSFLLNLAVVDQDTDQSLGKILPTFPYRSRRAERINIRTEIKNGLRLRNTGGFI